MFIRFMMYPPGTVLDETRDKMFQLVTFIAGVVSGWVLHGEQAQVKDVVEDEQKKTDAAAKAAAEAYESLTEEKSKNEKLDT